MATENDKVYVKTFKCYSPHRSDTHMHNSVEVDVKPTNIICQIFYKPNSSKKIWVNLYAFDLNAYYETIHECNPNNNYFDALLNDDNDDPLAVEFSFIDVIKIVATGEFCTSASVYLKKKSFIKNEVINLSYTKCKLTDLVYYIKGNCILNALPYLFPIFDGECIDRINNTYFVQHSFNHKIVINNYIFQFYIKSNIAIHGNVDLRINIFNTISDKFYCCYINSCTEEHKKNIMSIVKASEFLIIEPSLELYLYETNGTNIKINLNESMYSYSNYLKILSYQSKELTNHILYGYYAGILNMEYYKVSHNTSYKKELADLNIKHGENTTDLQLQELKNALTKLKNDYDIFKNDTQSEHNDLWSACRELSDHTYKLDVELKSQKDQFNSYQKLVNKNIELNDETTRLRIVGRHLEDNNKKLLEKNKELSNTLSNAENECLRLHTSNNELMDNNNKLFDEVNTYKVLVADLRKQLAEGLQNKQEELDECNRQLNSVQQLNNILLEQATKHNKKINELQTDNSNLKAQLDELNTTWDFIDGFTLSNSDDSTSDGDDDDHSEQPPGENTDSNGEQPPGENNDSNGEQPPGENNDSNGDENVNQNVNQNVFNNYENTVNNSGDETI